MEHPAEAEALRPYAVFSLCVTAALLVVSKVVSKEVNPSSIVLKTVSCALGFEAAQWAACNEL